MTILAVGFTLLGATLLSAWSAWCLNMQSVQNWPRTGRKSWESLQ